MNRIRSVVQVDSSSTAPYPLIAITTTMDYDDDGNRIQVTDHRGVIRRWEYDAIGRDTAVVDEFNRKEIRRYDLADNLVLLKNRQRDSIRTVYDALGRDTLRIIGAVTFDGDETSYYWTGGLVYGPELIPEDQVRTEYDPMGRITKTENLSGSRVTRIWNKEGTLKSETQTLKIPTPPPATTFSYTYNRASERVSMTSSLYNRTFTYSYDAGGALSSISIPGVGSVHLRHDALGRRDSVAYPNGTVAKYRFDADGRVRKIDVVKGGVTQLSLAYSNYDAVGRVLTLTRSGTRALPQPQLFSWTYGYRGFLRRTAVDGIGSSYRYDESGNLIWKDEAGVVSTYAIQAGSNRIQARTRGVREYTTRYDLNGNLTHEVRADDPSFRQYLYHDALNRLVKTVYPESEILYHYDGLGRTVRRPIPAWSRAWQMYDGSNVAIHNNVEFIHGSGVDDPLVALAPPGQGICGNWSAAYFVTLGNRLLDFQGADGADCTASASWTMFASFAGAIQDSYSFNLVSSNSESGESGGMNVQLSHFRNRHYSAEHGRFLQEDPIGLAGGLNLYQYAGNNPASYTDPFGLCPMCIGGGIGAAVGAGGTLLRNYLTDRPLTENLVRNTIIGAAAGATLGAGYSLLASSSTAATAGGAALPIVASAQDKLGQLATRFGTSANQIVSNALTTGQRFIDNANRGNINVLIQRPDGGNGFIRVTLDPNMERVISAGLMRANQVANAIEGGRFTPIQ